MLISIPLVLTIGVSASSLIPRVSSADILADFQREDNQTRGVIIALNQWDGSAGKVLPVIRSFDVLIAGTKSLNSDLQAVSQLNDRDSKTLLDIASGRFVPDLKTLTDALISHQAQIERTNSKYFFQTRIHSLTGNLTVTTNLLPNRVSSTYKAAAVSASSGIAAQSTRLNNTVNSFR